MMVERTVVVRAVMRAVMRVVMKAETMALVTACMLVVVRVHVTDAWLVDQTVD